MVALATDFPSDLTLAQRDTATLRRVYGAAVIQTAVALHKWVARPDQRALALVLAELPDQHLRVLLRDPSTAVLDRTLLLQPCPLTIQSQTEVANALASRLRNPQAPPGDEIALHPAFPGVVLALSDHNPLPIFAEHPERRGNVVGLGPRLLQEWTAMLQQCLDLVARYLPLLADEMRMLLRRLVPAGFDAEKHQSASYLHNLGVIYLTLHPAVMTMTEALIHEFQHNKLHALLQGDAVIVNGGAAQFASPVRPDARPLRGVVLAVHAFLPVAELYRRMAAAGDPLSRSRYFGERFAQICAINRAGCATLRANAQWTVVGRNLWAEMDRLDKGFADSAP